MLTTQTLMNRARNVISDNNPDPTLASFADDELTDIIAEAIVEYSGYRPYRQRTTINTVALQDIYPLPSDCNWIVRVTQASNVDLSFLYNAYTYDFYSAWVNVTEMMMRDRTLFAIRQDAFELFTERGTPTWALWNDKQLIIYPAPMSDGYPLFVEYASIHAADSSGNYPTIPDQDIIPIKRLVEAQCLDTIATTFSLKGNYREGQTEVTYDPDKLRQRSQYLRAQVHQALDDGVALRA